MDYLDYELMRYQEEQEAYCDICGEYSTEDWQCECCRECEKSSCECSEEYEDILGV